MSAVTLLPAWKNAVAVLFSGRYTYGDVIPHEELRDALGLPRPAGKISAEDYEKWRLHLLSQVDALGDWLLEEKRMYLKSLQGSGYMIMRPEEQTQEAVRHGRKKIRSELRKMAKRLTYVDHSSLTTDQQRENADALARLAFMQQQFGKAKRLKFGSD